MAQVAWIATIDEEEASGQTAAAYDQAASRETGRVPHILKVSSLSPRALLAHRTLYRTLMFGSSPLARYQREIIATVVSSINECHY